MAGDWIKMRSNLWDDPRVSRLVDLTDSSETSVVGGLYWLWASADQHSEDGIMQGLTLKAIDRKTGIKGFGEALVAIGWIEDNVEGVRIVRFEEHNGKSAKRRCSESVRKMSARDADKDQTDSGQDAEGERKESSNGAHLEKEKEKDIEKEESKTKTTRAPRFDAQAHLLNLFVPADLASDWIKLRKAKKAEVTKTAIEGIESEALKAGISLDAALRECCSRGWAGFKADWMAKSQPNQRASPVVSLEAKNKAVAAAWVPPEMRAQA